MLSIFFSVCCYKYYGIICKFSGTRDISKIKGTRRSGGVGFLFLNIEADFDVDKKKESWKQLDKHLSPFLKATSLFYRSD